MRILRRVALIAPYEFNEIETTDIKNFRQAKQALVNSEVLARLSKKIESLQDKHLEDASHD